MADSGSTSVNAQGQTQCRVIRLQLEVFRKLNFKLGALVGPLTTEAQDSGLEIGDVFVKINGEVVPMGASHFHRTLQSRRIYDELVSPEYQLETTYVEVDIRNSAATRVVVAREMRNAM